MINKNNILLPEGLKDLLIEEASDESELVKSLLGSFQSSGYEIVKPPLIEHEDSILNNVGKKLEENMFKLIDPKTQKTLCLRPDITIQISRIASSRLLNVPRPLRLSYSGDILRLRTTQIRPERQFNQTGFELIGEESHLADIEVISLAVESLKKIGVLNISIDLTLPTFIQTVCNDLDLSSEETAVIRGLLDKKDLASLRKLKFTKETNIFESVLNSIGPVTKALGILDSLKLSDKAKNLISHIDDVYKGLKKDLPDIIITLDLSELNGFEYHTGLGFSLFSPQAKSELGKGGRYLTSNSESAVGFSVYLDSLLKISIENKKGNRILIPLAASFEESKKLRDAGWLTVKLFKESTNLYNDAVNLRCSYIFYENEPRPLDQIREILR